MLDKLSPKIEKQVDITNHKDDDQALEQDQVLVQWPTLPEQHQQQLTDDLIWPKGLQLFQAVNFFFLPHRDGNRDKREFEA